MELYSTNVLWVFAISLSCFICHTRAQCLLNPTLKVDDDEAGGPRQKMLDLLNRLSPDFRNKEYKTDVNKKPFVARICPDDKAVTNHSGFDEIDRTTIRSLGRINESDVSNSSRGDIVMLSYTNGDDYGNACNRGERRVFLYLRPCLSESEEGLKFVTESVGMTEDFCYYMFELFLHRSPDSEKILSYSGGAPVVPAKKADDKTTVPPPHGDSQTETPASTPAHHGISTGWLIVILVLVPALLFVAIGALYKRFVAGAQGWEQVPFIDFWRRCGSLQSDGWRYVFGKRPRGGARYDDYTQVSTDEERQPALDQSHSNDDHLLPM